MTDQALDPAGTAPPQTPFRRAVSDFCESRLALVGLFLVAISAFIALFAPWISPQDPFDIASLDLLDSKVPPGTASSDGKMIYWLGTDGQARDMLSVSHYVPLHSSPGGKKFGRAQGSFKVTDDISDRLLRLPIYFGITDAEVDSIIDAVKGCFAQRRREIR